MNNDALLLDDALWERLLELTGGQVALCYQCGECTAACPWGEVSQRPLAVRSLIRQAQLGMEHIAPDLWQCTTCGQCSSTCPRGVDIPGVFKALRQVAWEANQPEHGFPSLLWSLYWNENPWSQPPSQRAAWAAKLELPDFDPAQHEILFYVGCTSSYNRRLQKVAYALVQLLNAAGVKFGYLGNEEPCCGEAALSIGHKPYFDEITAHTREVFLKKSVKQLVVLSPHCFDVFKNHYTDMPADWQPFHYTQYLADLLAGGRLSLPRRVERTVTFQDPCYLGRLNGEYDAPRAILSAIPGLKFVEMEPAREAGLCCGGGGGRMWLETPVGERFSDLRMDQALLTGADALATACPFCLSCLEDSANLQSDHPLEVLDVAELAARSLAGGAA